MDPEEYTGTVTQKGQVTIPLPVRQRLGVKPRNQVRFWSRKRAYNYCRVR